MKLDYYVELYLVLSTQKKSNADFCQINMWNHLTCMIASVKLRSNCRSFCVYTTSTAPKFNNIKYGRLLLSISVDLWWDLMYSLMNNVTMKWTLHIKQAFSFDYTFSCFKGGCEDLTLTKPEMCLMTKVTWSIYMASWHIVSNGLPYY